ncbi:hypothetical protein BGZ80_010312, partial [Entomortierella chlamydospora]
MAIINNRSLRPVRNLNLPANHPISGFETVTTANTSRTGDDSATKPLSDSLVSHESDGRNDTNSEPDSIGTQDDPRTSSF